MIDFKIIIKPWSLVYAGWQKIVNHLKECLWD